MTRKDKILYLSDGYAKKVRGTKSSIFHEMRNRGYNITFQTVHSKRRNNIDGVKLLRQISSQGYTWIWVAHTWVRFVGCTLEDINQAGAQVLGFGFSDPYRWNPAKLDQYNYYASNYIQTSEHLRQEGKPVTAFCTAGDQAFHRDLGLNRDIDVLIFGLGEHPQFKPRDYRIQLVQQLMQALPDLTFRIHGNRWGRIAHQTQGQIVGREFLQTINRAKVSLDLQQPHAPLAHRMFECMMCGTPVITRDREEVRRMFRGSDLPGLYTSFEDLVAGIQKTLGSDWNALSQRVRAHSLQKHNISHRVDSLLSWLSNFAR